MGNESDVRTMSNLIYPGTVRRTNDILYSASALVSGVAIGDTLTRDYDIWDAFGSASWAAENGYKSLGYTPITGETGTVFSLMFDGSKYCYQEWAYDQGSLGCTEITANR